MPDWDTHASKHIGTANLVDGLYHIVEEKNQCLVNNLSNFKTNDIDVWHFRLGHPSKKILEYICKNNIEIQYDNINICDHCYYAKQHIF